MTQEWLHFNAMVLNRCAKWYQRIMDPKKNNCFFELPISASISEFKDLPEPEEECSVLRYPQNGVGACDIAAMSSVSMSSAFHFSFSNILSLRIHQRRDKYLDALAESIGRIQFWYF